MFIIDWIAYVFVAVPIIAGLALSALLLIWMILIPIGMFIEEYDKNPAMAWHLLFWFIVALSAVWLDYRNRGLL